MKVRNNGRWTEARFNSFIKGILRRGSTKWGVKYDVLNEAKRGKIKNKKTGRLAEHYECNECHKLFPLKEVAVDHVILIIQDEFTSWDDVIEKMFCEKDNLQVLCKSCHKRKSFEEGRIRREHRSKNKEE